jgi:type IV secretion system protein TrbL
MDDLNVIDRFTQTFTAYIDSGFGLLTGEVAFLTSVLVAIDITLAGLFWALNQESDVLARLIRKVLYVGVFALLLNNWSLFSDILFQSFSGLGLKATSTSLSAQDLLRPGAVAGTGFEAAYPLLQKAGSVVTFSTSLLSNLVTALVLLFAWAVVVLAFFILAIQLFITIIEFKLTMLAGFILVPFALWNKTAFLAERVLGNVVGAGIKMMVLAVIIGIGSTLFADFVSALQGREPNIAQAMSLVLGALSLFGLGIFGPGIAAGLTSGAPQLGAGAAIGTAGAVAAGTLVGAGAAVGAARVLGAGGLSAMRAGTSLASGASTAYGLGQATSGATGTAGVAAGLAGVGRAGAGAVLNAARDLGARASGSFAASAQQGRQAAWRGTGGRGPADEQNATAAQSSGGIAPGWARRLRAEQRQRTRLHTTEQAIKDGDKPGSGANPDLDEREG